MKILKFLKLPITAFTFFSIVIAIIVFILPGAANAWHWNVAGDGPHSVGYGYAKIASKVGNMAGWNVIVYKYFSASGTPITPTYASGWVGNFPGGGVGFNSCNGTCTNELRVSGFPNGTWDITYSAEQTNLRNPTQNGFENISFSNQIVTIEIYLTDLDVPYTGAAPHNAIMGFRQSAGSPDLPPNTWLNFDPYYHVKLRPAPWQPNLAEIKIQGGSNQRDYSSSGPFPINGSIPLGKDEVLSPLGLTDGWYTNIVFGGINGSVTGGTKDPLSVGIDRVRPTSGCSASWLNSNTVRVSRTSADQPGLSGLRLLSGDLDFRISTNGVSWGVWWPINNYAVSGNYDLGGSNGALFYQFQFRVMDNAGNYSNYAICQVNAQPATLNVQSRINGTLTPGATITHTGGSPQTGMGGITQYTRNSTGAIDIRLRVDTDPLNGAAFVNWTGCNSTDTVPPATKPTTCSVTVGLGSSKTVTANYTISPPTCDIRANGSNGPITIPYNTAATISWNSTNATSGTVLPPGWTGTSNSGISTGNLTSSTTYTCTVNGPGGSGTDSVTVNVGPLLDAVLIVESRVNGTLTSNANITQTGGSLPDMGGTTGVTPVASVGRYTKTSTSAIAVRLRDDTDPLGGAPFANWSGPCEFYVSGTTCNISVSPGFTKIITANYVSALPDLIISSPFAPSGVINSQMTITADVWNDSVTATPAGVTFYNRLRIDLNNDGSWDINPVNPDSTSGPLTASHSSPLSWYWTPGPGQAGAHRGEICADSSNVVPESNAFGTGETNNCQPFDINVEATAPWVETENGNVGSLSNIDMRFSPPALENNSEYIIQSTAISNFRSLKNWLVSSQPNPKTPKNYEDFKNEFNPDPTCTFSDNQFPNNRGKFIYTTGNLSITPATSFLPIGGAVCSTSKDAAVIFVETNLNINVDNFTPTRPTVFIVKGKINITPNVRRIDAILISDRSFSSGTNGPGLDNQLLVNGSIIGTLNPVVNSPGDPPDKVNLERSNLNYLIEPSEQIILQPSYFYYLTDLIGVSATFTREERP